MAWLDRGRVRMLVNGTGMVTDWMKIIQPLGVVFSGGDGTVVPDVPVLVQAWPNNTYLGDYITVAQCETAMGLVYFQPETLAVIEEMEDVPTTIQANDLNQLVIALQAAGDFWAKTAILYVCAAHARQAALINWKDPGTYSAVEVEEEELIFTVDSGFQSDAGGIAFCDTTFNPFTAALLFARDSAHVGVYVTNNADGTDLDLPVCGNVKTQILPRTNDISMQTRGNTTVTSTVTLPSLPSITSAGHSLWSRSVSGQYEVYKDGTLISTVSEASEALTDDGPLCFAGIDSVNDPLHIVGAFHAGGALTAQEVADARAAFFVYMQARGNA